MRVEGRVRSGTNVPRQDDPFKPLRPVTPVARSRPAGRRAWCCGAGMDAGTNQDRDEHHWRFATQASQASSTRSRNCRRVSAELTLAFTVLSARWSCSAISALVQPRASRSTMDLSRGLSTARRSRARRASSSRARPCRSCPDDPQRLAQRRVVMPAHRRPPRGRAVEGDDQPHERRLPRSVGPQQTRHRTGSDLERHVVERDRRPVPLGQPINLNHAPTVATGGGRHYRRKLGIRPASPGDPSLAVPARSVPRDAWPGHGRATDPSPRGSGRRSHAY